MTIEELSAMLTEGLPEDQAKVVRDAIARDVVKAKASGLKQQSEFDTLAAREADLRAKLEGSRDKPGASAYQQWYEQNFAQIQKLQADMAKYQEKYGTLDAPKETNVTPPPAKTFSEDDIRRAVDERIQSQYGQQWSNLLTSTGTLVQKHMFAGRKTPIDFEALGKLATEKYKGDLNLAYEELDRPEREKLAKEETEKEIERRVQERIQKQGASVHFPSGADATPGTLAQRSSDKFDKTAMLQDLVGTFVSTGEKVQ